jgi:HEAT repeat protein
MTQFHPRASIEQLRNIIAGRDRSIPRIQAVALMSNSDFAEKHKDLEMLLENSQEPAKIRILAAAGLGDINKKEAMNALIKNTQIDDQSVLASIVRAMGKYGDRGSLESVLKAKERSEGFVASQAAFAAAVISYRLGLQGNDLPIPTNILDVPNNGKQIEISQANQKELKICLRSLGEESYGIKLSDKRAYQLSFGKTTDIMVLNQDFITQNAIEVLLERKAILGIVAEKNNEDGHYFVLYLVLASPSRDPPRMINLLLASPGGRILHVGKAEIKNNEIAFSVHSVAEVGIIPVKISGIIRDERLEILSARLSSVIPLRIQPKEEDRPI